MTATDSHVHPYSAKLPTQSSGAGRVLIITPQPFYEDRGTPIALRNVLTALSERGYSADVLAFPFGETPTIPGVSVLRTANPLRFRSVPIGFSWRKAFLDLFLFFEAWRLLRRSDYGWVHCVEEAVFVGALLGGRRGVPVIYDMASSLPDELSRTLPLNGRFLTRVLRKLEAWALRRVKLVVCSTGLQGHVNCAAPNVRCREWRFPAMGSVVSSREVRQLAASLNIGPDRRVLVYVGNAAPYQGVELLIEAALAVSLRAPEPVFVIVGIPHDDLPRVRCMVDGRDADSIRIVERQPRHLVPRYLALADYVISPRLRGDNLPSKIFEYVASGKTILASDIPAHRAELDDGRAVFFEPTTQGLTEVIVGALDGKDKSRALESTFWHGDDAVEWSRFVDFVDRVYRDTDEAASRHHETIATPPTSATGRVRSVPPVV